MSADLTGTTVAITRDDAALASALEAGGATVATVPLLATAPPDADDMRSLRAVDLGSYDWLLLTSANGVAALAEHLGTPPPDVRIGVVGAATAAAVAGVFGRVADFVPTDQRAAGMVAEFDAAPARIVVVHADLAAPTLVDGLRAAGHDVTPVVAYRTVPRTPTPAETQQLAAADVVVVASGSAVRALATTTAIAALRLVAIGPSTAAVAEELGVRDLTVAANPSTAALVEAVGAAVTGA